MTAKQSLCDCCAVTQFCLRSDCYAALTRRSRYSSLINLSLHTINTRAAIIMQGLKKDDEVETTRETELKQVDPEFSIETLIIYKI